MHTKKEDIIMSLIITTGGLRHEGLNRVTISFVAVTAC